MERKAKAAKKTGAQAGVSQSNRGTSGSQPRLNTSYLRHFPQAEHQSTAHACLAWIPLFQPLLEREEAARKKPRGNGDRVWRKKGAAGEEGYVHKRRTTRLS